MTSLLTPAARRRMPKPLLSSEDFLDWLEPGIHADLIGGQIHMHSPVNLRHAALVNFVDHLVRTYMEEIDDQGVLHRETVAVRLSARETFLPDLCYFTAAQARRLSPTHASFAPTLVVEALSPSTAKRDRGLKFSAYELHGVQECWLLDPDNLEHKFYRRGGDMLDEVDGGVDKITCTSIPGFWVKRSWLDPDKLPKIKQCVKEVLRATSHR